MKKKRKKSGSVFFVVLVFTAEVRNPVSAKHDRSHPSAIEHIHDQSVRLRATIAK